MAKTAILAVKIISDAKDAIAGMDQVGGKAGKLSGALKVAGGAALTLGAALVGATIKGIGSAGDLEQSIGAVDAVFKDSAGQMHAWADDAAETLGLAKNEYNELATILGAQLKNGGTALDELGGKTHDLLGVGSDLSAMFGGTTKEAVEALSSALKGERDPIERYGVSLKQATIDAKAAELGFTKVGGSLSDEAQQAATLALIMEQTSDAHGAFARESDTLAHKQQVFGAKLENLSAKLGAIFLPIASAVFGFLGDVAVPALERVIEWLAPLGDLIQRFAGGLSSAATPLQGLTGGANALADGFRTNIMPAIQRAGDTIQGWADRIRPIVTEITDAVLGKFREWQPIIGEIFTAVTQIIGGAIDLIVAIIEPAITRIMWVWENWGDTIMTVVGVVFENVLILIRTAMQVISGIIKTVTSIIRGDWRGAWEGIKQIGSAVWNGITQMIRNQITAAQNILNGAYQRIRGATSDAWAAVQQYVSNGISNVVQYVTGLPGRVMGALSSLRSQMAQLGRDMMQGMINGIRNMASRLANAARDTVRSAVNSAKNFLGIRSPSRLWANLGYESVRGLVQALDAGHSVAGRAGHNLAHAATDGATVAPPGIDLPGGRSAAGGVTVNITVNGATDPRAVAAQIRDLLNHDARVRGVVDLAGVVVA